MDNRFAMTTRPRGASTARPAVLDALVGMSSTQSWAVPFSVADRTLVILIENGGVDLGIPTLVEKLIDLIPGSSALGESAKRELVELIRKRIKDATDALLEDFELSLNRYRAAKGTLFNDVIVLRDGTASYDALRKTLLDLTKARKLIDLLILTHGRQDLIAVAGGIDSQKIRDLKTANNGPLSIRTVYMMNCVGSSLNQAWLDIGARASAGSIKNNYLPEPTTFFFWQSWKEGQSFEAAATGAYRKAVNFLNEIVRSFVRKLPIAGDFADRLSLGDLDFIRGSAPLVQGQGSVTIATDDLSFAKSISSSLATTVVPTSLVQSLADSAAALPARRRVSPAGIEFIKSWDTFRARLHNDENRNCAIGYGTVLHAGPCDGRPIETKYSEGISDKDACDLVVRRAAEVQELVNEHVTVPLTQNQNDALVSLACDIGGHAFAHSTLLRLLNQGNTAAVPDEIRRWTRARGRNGIYESSELAERRNAEAKLFTTPDAPRGRSGSLSIGDGLAGSFAAIDYTVPGVLPVYAQPTPKTCWAAVFAMMYVWKRNTSISIREAVTSLGGRYVALFDADSGLDSTTAKDLYRDAGLETLDSFNPTIDGWLALLRKYGPLYVDVGYNNANAGTHAIIVQALRGDGTAANTKITYVDPLVGSVVTIPFSEFITKYEGQSAVRWPYTIVHWPAGQATSNANSLPISHAYCYESPRTGTLLSRQAQVAPLVVGGIEVADAAQIGLAGVSILQQQVATSQGAFTLTYDKAERLLSNAAREHMPGARSGKQRYRRVVLHLPLVRVGTAYADVVAEWEGNAYGEISTVVIRRDLANSTEFSHSSATINFTLFHPIQVAGADPRAWPITYVYEGTFDPLGRGYWEFQGDFEINAFGGIDFHNHVVKSRSFGDWALGEHPEVTVQRGPTVYAATPEIPKDQLEYVKEELIKQ